MSYNQVKLVTIFSQGRFLYASMRSFSWSTRPMPNLEVVCAVDRSFKAPAPIYRQLISVAVENSRKITNLRIDPNSDRTPQLDLL
jgi:hypothetical protein